MYMKLNIKNVIIVVLICILAGFSLSFLSIYIAGYKPRVAFYNVNERTVKAIQKELNTLPQKNGKPFKYESIILDNETPLSAQKKIKKAKIVFAVLDQDSKDFALTSKRVKPQNIALTNGMPSTTRANLVSKDENLYAVPLLYDFYLIEVNRNLYNQTQMKGVSDWADFTEFLERAKSLTMNPFVFAGGNDTALLDFFASLTEAVSGKDVLLSAEKKLYEASKKGNLQTTADTLLSEGGELFDTAQELTKLIQKGLISSEVFGMSEQDVEFFMTNNLCASSAQLLSQHREIPFETVKNFTSIYIPGVSSDAQRAFFAPQIVAIPLSKKPYVTSAMNILSSSRQDSLCYSASLAPVSSSCATPDIQSDDARFWVAASEGSIFSLSSVMPGKDNLHILAETVRKYR